MRGRLSGLRLLLTAWVAASSGLLWWTMSTDRPAPGSLAVPYLAGLKLHCAANAVGLATNGVTDETDARQLSSHLNVGSSSFDASMFATPDRLADMLARCDSGDIESCVIARLVALGELSRVRIIANVGGLAGSCIVFPSSDCAILLSVLRNGIGTAERTGGSDSLWGRAHARYCDHAPSAEVRDAACEIVRRERERDEFMQKVCAWY